MKNFQRDVRPGGWKGPNKFGGKKPWERGSGGRDSFDRPSMHKATCNECGQSCEVPFKPNGRKPIFCSNCFRREEGPAPMRFGDRDSGRQMFDEKRLYEAVCDTCGNNCEVPFRPTGEKPIYCRQCFVKPEGRTQTFSTQKPSEDYKDHFRMINKKLDTLLALLSPAVPAKMAFDEPMIEIKQSEKKVKKTKKTTKSKNA